METGQDAKTMNPIRAWFIKKRFFIKSRPRIIAWEKDGRKFVVVLMCGWRGKKWARRFEVVNELDEHDEPSPFQGANVQSV